MLGQIIQALTESLGNPTHRSGRIPLNPNASNSSILPNPHTSDTYNLYPNAHKADKTIGSLQRVHIILLCGDSCLKH